MRSQKLGIHPLILILIVAGGFLSANGCATKKVTTENKQEMSGLDAAPYATPEATFNTWKRAARQLNLGVLAETVASGIRERYRRDMARQSSEGLKAMQTEARETDFKIEKVVYVGNHAHLRVLRNYQGNKEIEIINMVKEGKEWKLIP